MASNYTFLSLLCILTTFTVLCICIFSRILSHPPQFHKIQYLPGQPEVVFNQFSGYISVDTQNNRSLFYYFVEAESQPASKALVLWLSGGPGCSSVGTGAFVEHGPFKPKNNALIKNEYSWNKEANMLYLESPAGVGFSYSSDKLFYDHVDDEMTAQDNLIFLERWLDMFPTFKGRDFFITGESYGGHYVPQLAQLIQKSNMQINLKGIAVGNPLLEFNTDYNSRGEYFWSHGLISDATYMLFQTTCNFSTFERQSLNGAVTPKCKGVMDQAISDYGDIVNLFDVSVDVCMNDPETDSEIAACIEWFTIAYLNRRDVQKALHARLVGVDSWLLCSNFLHYDVQSIQAPTIDLLGTLVKSGIRVLIFSGDQDSFLPLTGTRKLIDGLANKLNINTTMPYSHWMQGHKVGGWTQTYGDNLTFATIRGAGHEAAVSQPERSLILFKSFVTGKSLPKPLAHR